MSGIAIVQATGKLGNEVYSRNQHGNFVMAKVDPSQPASTYRDDQQSFFQSVMSAWQALAPELQEQWNEIAELPAWQSKNKLGIPYSPSGRELFFKVNLTRDRYGSISSTLPVKVQLNNCKIVSLTHDGTGPGPNFYPILTFTWNANPTDPNQILQIWVTGYLSTGITRPKPSYFKNFVVATSTAPSTSEDFGSAYVARFGGFQTGKRIFVRSRIISMDSGDSILTAQTYCDT